MALHLVPRSILYFEHVAQLGSIQAASRKIGISASAIHRQIVAIEEAVGEPLFEREANGMTLTPTGYLMLELARDWRIDSARLWSTIQEARGVEQGTIRIAAMDGMVNGLVPELVHALAGRFPKIQPEIEITSPDAAVKGLINGEFDLAVVVNVAEQEKLKVHWSQDFPLGCICTKDHPLAQRSGPKLAEIILHPIVFQSSALAIRKLLELRHSWIFERPSASVVVNSIQLMKQLVVSGSHVAITSELDAAPEIETGALMFLPIKNQDLFEQKFSVVSNAMIPENAATTEVLSLTTDIMIRRYGSPGSGTAE